MWNTASFGWNIPHATLNTDCTINCVLFFFAIYWLSPSHSGNNKMWFTTASKYEPNNTRTYNILVLINAYTWIRTQPITFAILLNAVDAQQVLTIRRKHSLVFKRIVCESPYRKDVFILTATISNRSTTRIDHLRNDTELPIRAFKAQTFRRLSRNRALHVFTRRDKSASILLPILFEHVSANRVHQWVIFRYEINRNCGQFSVVSRSSVSHITQCKKKITAEQTQNQVNRIPCTQHKYIYKFATASDYARRRKKHSIARIFRVNVIYFCDAINLRRSEHSARGLTFLFLFSRANHSICRF